MSELADILAAIARLEAKLDRLARSEPRRRLLSKRAAATYLGIGRTTLEALLHDEAIRTVKTPAGVRFALPELDRYLAEGPRSPSAPRVRGGKLPSAGDPGEEIRRLKVP